ncbi:MAG: hypothetical protein U0892_03140 [Pirellulales bacterium]
MILTLRHPSAVPTVADDAARAVAKDVCLLNLRLAMPNLFAIQFVTISSRRAAKSRDETSHRVIPVNRDDAETVAVNQVAMIRVVVSLAAAKAREPNLKLEIRCVKMNAVTNNVDESPVEVNLAVLNIVAVNPIVVKEAAVRDGLEGVGEGRGEEAAGERRERPPRPARQPAPPREDDRDDDKDFEDPSDMASLGDDEDGDNRHPKIPTWAESLAIIAANMDNHRRSEGQHRGGGHRGGGRPRGGGGGRR